MAVDASNTGSGMTVASAPRSSIVARLLRVPLVLKLAGAHVVIVVAVVISLVIGNSRGLGPQAASVVMGVALLASLVASTVLAVLALKPLRNIERTLNRFRKGETASRVPDSPLADDNLLRVGHTLNALLDGWDRDRERLRSMAERVIMLGDQERSQLARDLYDSTAQSMAAALLELSAASSLSESPAARERLDRVRRITADVLEEIRVLSHAAHPRLLEDRGLGAALPQLVQEFSDLGRARITLVTAPDVDDVGDGVAVN